MTKQMRVLIVDDDAFTRVTLTTTLRALGYTVVGDAESASVAIRTARRLAPNIAVLDLNLGPGPTGIDVAHALRGELPSIGIVMLSTYEEPRLVGHNLPELPAGSVYVVKRTITNPDVLLRARRMAVDEDAHTEATRFVLTAESGRLEGISDQQVEIMRLIAAGHTNAEIARRRNINEASVEKAVARLIKHFDIKSDKTQNQRVKIAQLYFELTGATTAHHE